jgi:hypothetical protein
MISKWRSLVPCQLGSPSVRGEVYRVRSTKTGNAEQTQSLRQDPWLRKPVFVRTVRSKPRAVHEWIIAHWIATHISQVELRSSDYVCAELEHDTEVETPLNNELCPRWMIVIILRQQ